MKKLPAIAAVILLVLGVAWWQWHRTGKESEPAVGAPVTLAGFAQQANARLPRPYVDGFVVRSIRVDGQRLVTDIASTDIALADLDPARIPQIRDQEQRDLISTTCGNPDLLALTHGGVTVVRRFLDKDGKLIFELAATDKFCGRQMN